MKSSNAIDSAHATECRVKAIARVEDHSSRGDSLRLAITQRIRNLRSTVCASGIWNSDAMPK
jgi:hypothetical protein